MQVARMEGGKMLQNEFTAVLRAKNQEDLLREVLRCAHGLGVGTAMAVVDHCAGELEFASMFSDEGTGHGEDAA